MQLIDFQEIHSPAFQSGHDITAGTSPYSATPTYYKAVDAHQDAVGNYDWSDVQNWVTETFDTASNGLSMLYMSTDG